MKLVVAISKNEVKETAKIVSEFTGNLEAAEKNLTTPQGFTWNNEDGSQYMKINYIEDNVGDNGGMLVDVDIPEEITLKTAVVAAKAAKFVYSAINLFSNLAEEINEIIKGKKRVSLNKDEE